MLEQIVRNNLGKRSTSEIRKILVAAGGVTPSKANDIIKRVKKQEHVKGRPAAIRYLQQSKHLVATFVIFFISVLAMLLICARFDGVL